MLTRNMYGLGRVTCRWSGSLEKKKQEEEINLKCIKRAWVGEMLKVT